VADLSVLNALGGVAWATSIGLLAYFVGHSAEKFIRLAGLGGAVVVVLGGAVLSRTTSVVESSIRAGSSPLAGGSCSTVRIARAAIWARG